jgi:hypothetical protein
MYVYGHLCEGYRIICDEPLDCDLTVHIKGTKHLRRTFVNLYVRQLLVGVELRELPYGHMTKDINQAAIYNCIRPTCIGG